jgi:PhnB protein
MSTKKGVSITPHLVCRNAAQAIEFYRKAFGAETVMVHKMPDGKVMHANLALGEATVFLCDEFDQGCGSRSPQTLGGTPVVIHLEVDDCDKWFERAVAAGCSVTMPLQDQFWGDRYGAVADPYGHRWSIATHVRDVSPEEMEKITKQFAHSGA